MKIKFNNKIVLFFALLTLIFSCNDVEEDVTNTGQVSTESLTVEGQLNAVYSSLQRRTVFDAQGYPYLWGDAGVDIFSAPRFDRISAPIFRNDFRVTDQENLAMWRDHYLSLADVNRAIDFFGQISREGQLTTPRGFEAESLDELSRDLIAQARFVRAILNFNLVKAYENPVLVLDNGGTLITDVNDIDLSPRANSNPTEFFNVIIDDLIFAENNLINQSGTFKRATVTAAKALLGKVYLQAAGCLRNDVYLDFSVSPRGADGSIIDGGTSLTDIELYSLAAEKLQEVINSGAYSLMANYGDIFDPNEDAENTEMIFQVDFTSNGVGTGSSLGDFYGINGGVPNGGNRPVSPQYEFITSYFDHSLIFLNDNVFDSNNDGVVGLDTTDPLDGIVDEPEPFVPREFFGEPPFNFESLFNRAFYPLPVSDQRFLVNIGTFNVSDVNNTNDIGSVRKNQSIGGLGVYKYRKQLPASPSETNDQDFDFPYLRYADVLLLRAEALIASNTSLDEATELINMVRRRAYGINPTQAGGTTTNDLSLLNVSEALHTSDYEPPYLGTIPDGSGGSTVVVVTDNGGDNLIATDDDGNEIVNVQNLSLNEIRTIPGAVAPVLAGPDFPIQLTNPDNGRTSNAPPGAVILNPDNLFATLGNNERAAKLPTILPTPGLLVDIPSGQTSDALLRFVLRERRKELCYEGHRRDDLIRNGVTQGTSALSDVINNRVGEISQFSVDEVHYGDDASDELFEVNGQNANPNLPSDFFQSIDYRLPIPQIERNRNSLLRQNPGYPGS